MTGQPYRLCARLITLITACCISACAMLPTPRGDEQASTGDDLIIVAVADAPEVRPAAGASPRARYARGAGYVGSDRALALADELAHEHRLESVAAWTITTLNWRCMLYRLSAGEDRERLLARLALDDRVRLAQPLNEFHTLAAASTYDDPYLPLQTGFGAIDAAGAQRVARGQGVTVAVIDTGVDENHPDLRDRLAGVRDFVRRPQPTRGERHGTEVAGVIGAVANNGLGIVGVAPASRILSLRGCWSEAAREPARCTSFTLALALSAALTANVDVINLSLGGPADPLLEALLLQAIRRGMVVVGATPPGGQRRGFPSAIAGVLAVASSDDGPAGHGVLAAPGRRILTLAPGGGYEFASGSSMASAHVAGAAALLRSADGRLDGAAVSRLLSADTSQGEPSIDVCRAVQRLATRGVNDCAAPRRR